LRFIPIPSPPNLPTRWATVYASRIAEVNAKGTHALRSAYIKKHGSWGLLKKWLSSVSANKCWYCEAKSMRAPFDVDHFRPKLAITVDGIKLAGHDGYYWLAYEWQNFRLSCQRCNRPEKDDTSIPHGKANEFPIQDETVRCFLPAGDANAESPKLLDPCREADCRLLAHGTDGEVKPIAQHGSWEYERARYTIDRLGFNEWNTPEDKRSRWQTLAILIAAADNIDGTSALEAELHRYLSNDHEYSCFFRSAIGTHSDKAWVEALL
jgi:uncharacterized protein (TIGR02646 family)